MVMITTNKVALMKTPMLNRRKVLAFILSYPIR